MQKKDGYEDWEREMARRKAKRVVNQDRGRAKAKQVGFTRSDIPDLEQELLIQIWIKRPKYDATHASGASLEQFLSYALDKFVASLLRDRTRKRRGGVRIQSLDVPISSEDESLATLGDILPEKSSPSEAVFKSDMGRLLAQLTRIQQEIGRKIMEGHELKDIGTSLGIPRMSLYREIARMRKVLVAQGLQEYLRPGTFRAETE